MDLKVVLEAVSVGCQKGGMGIKVVREAESVACQEGWNGYQGCV